MTLKRARADLNGKQVFYCTNNCTVYLYSFPGIWFGHYSLQLDSNVAYLTVQELNCIDIILLKTEVWYISSVVWIHDSIPDIRVMDTQWVTEFMSSHPQKVGTIVCSIGECFIFIKMRAAIWREESVCQDFAFSVEWIGACSLRASTVSCSSKAWNIKGNMKVILGGGDGARQHI